MTKTRIHAKVFQQQNLTPKNNMTEFFIHHDFLILLVLPVICWALGIFNDTHNNKSAEFGFLFGIFIWILEIFAVVIFATGHENDETWNSARIVKEIPAAELVVLELPNHEVEIWHESEKLKTLAKPADTFRKNQIEKIEYREKEFFGPDYSESRVIFTK